MSEIKCCGSINSNPNKNQLKSSQTIDIFLLINLLVVLATYIIAFTH
jgi:hypothetical protein